MRRKSLVALPASVSSRTTRSTLWASIPLLAITLCVLTVSQANAGDSRSVLGVKGRAKPLSFDHKPQNEGKAMKFLACKRTHCLHLCVFLQVRRQGLPLLEDS